MAGHYKMVNMIFIGSMEINYRVLSVSRWKNNQVNYFRFSYYLYLFSFFRPSLFNLFFTEEENKDNADDDDHDLDIQFQD